MNIISMIRSKIISKILPGVFLLRNRLKVLGRNFLPGKLHRDANKRDQRVTFLTKKIYSSVSLSSDFLWQTRSSQRGDKVAYWSLLRRLKFNAGDNAGSKKINKKTKKGFFATFQRGILSTNDPSIENDVTDFEHKRFSQNVPFPFENGPFNADFINAGPY